MAASASGHRRVDRSQPLFYFVPQDSHSQAGSTTVELEKQGSRKLRLTAKETIAAAEKLYTAGLISCPRTETNIFPKELQLAPLVEAQQHDNRWGEFAGQVLANGGPRPRAGTFLSKGAILTWAGGGGR